MLPWTRRWGFVTGTAVVQQYTGLTFFMILPSSSKETISRKFVRGVYRLFLAGIVTGNPSSCVPKTLPDVYNFIGNEKVNENFSLSPLEM